LKKVKHEIAAFPCEKLPWKERKNSKQIHILTQTRKKACGQKDVKKGDERGKEIGSDEIERDKLRRISSGGEQRRC